MADNIEDEIKVNNSVLNDIINVVNEENEKMISEYRTQLKKKFQSLKNIFIKENTIISKNKMNSNTKQINNDILVFSSESTKLLSIPSNFTDSQNIYNNKLLTKYKIYFRKVSNAIVLKINKYKESIILYKNYNKRIDEILNKLKLELSNKNTKKYKKLSITSEISMYSRLSADNDSIIKQILEKYKAFTTEYNNLTKNYNDTINSYKQKIYTSLFEYYNKKIQDKSAKISNTDFNNITKPVDNITKLKEYKGILVELDKYISNITKSIINNGNKNFNSKLVIITNEVNKIKTKVTETIQKYKKKLTEKINKDTIEIHELTEKLLYNIRECLKGISHKSNTLTIATGKLEEYIHMIQNNNTDINKIKQNINLKLGQLKTHTNTVGKAMQEQLKNIIDRIGKTLKSSSTSSSVNLINPLVSGHSSKNLIGDINSTITATSNNYKKGENITLNLLNQRGLKKFRITSNLSSNRKANIQEILNNGKMSTLHRSIIIPQKQ